MPSSLSPYSGDPLHWGVLPAQQGESAQPQRPPAWLQGSGHFSFSPAPRFHCSYKNLFLSSNRSGLMQGGGSKGQAGSDGARCQVPVRPLLPFPSKPTQKTPTEKIRKAAPACATGRHHLPAAACQAQGWLLSSSSRSAASRQQEHSARDGRAERSSAPRLHGKRTDASHQSQQLLDWLHHPKSLAQSWPRGEGCKEGRLKGKPLQVGGGTGSTKGMPQPAQAQHPQAGQHISPRRSDSLCARGCLALAIRR